MIINEMKMNLRFALYGILDGKVLSADDPMASIDRCNKNLQKDVMMAEAKTDDSVGRH